MGKPQTYTIHYALILTMKFNFWNIIPPILLWNVWFKSVCCMFRLEPEHKLTQKKKTGKYILCGPYSAAEIEPPTF